MFGPISKSLMMLVDSKNFLGVKGATIKNDPLQMKFIYIQKIKGLSKKYFVNSIQVCPFPFFLWWLPLRDQDKATEHSL